MAIIDAGPRTGEGAQLSPMGPARADRAVGNDDWGAFSLEKFATAGGLSYTHEDADGFLAYCTKFQPANFHYMDAGVQVWAYEEAYDAWQDQYGFDACCAVYHSGHGGMNSQGVFWAPLGAAWGNRGTDAISTNMALGNEAARYIFWSTCLSLRVLDGHSPVRTWWNACQGFRMLFGYETVSFDNPNYGKFFWDHWVAGDSLSKAWLNAGWQISHNQAPSAMAVGANQAEASNRLYNERFMTRERATKGWFQWTWYNAAKSADRNLAPPAEMLVAHFAPPASDERRARALMERFEIDAPEAQRTPRGILLAGTESGGPRLAIHPNGAVDVHLAKPERESTTPLGLREARVAAESAVARFGLASEVDVTFDAIRLQREAGGTEEGSGDRVEPRTIETTVEFRQVVNGVPVVTPGAGIVRITLDNEGTVTQVHDATRTVDRLRSGGVGDAPAPDADSTSSPVAASSVSDESGIEAAFGSALRERLLASAIHGGAPLGYEVVPNSTVVGYDVRGDSARPVARREVEFDFGRGLRKRYALVAALAE